MADATNKIAGKGKLGPEAAAQGASLVSDGVALMSKVTRVRVRARVRVRVRVRLG